jgi:hypothetical protein
MQTRSVYTPDAKWATQTDFPGEAEVIALRDEPSRKARTLLVRIQPGGHAASHCHVGTVQHFVVDGEYESGGQTFAAGTFRQFPEHAEIGEITSERGATILMIYDPVPGD